MPALKSVALRPTSQPAESDIDTTPEKPAPAMEKWSLKPVSERISQSEPDESSSITQPDSDSPKSFVKKAIATIDSTEKRKLPPVPQKNQKLTDSNKTENTNPQQKTPAPVPVVPKRAVPPKEPVSPMPNETTQQEISPEVLPPTDIPLPVVSAVEVNIDSPMNTTADEAVDISSSGGANSVSNVEIPAPELLQTVEVSSTMISVTEPSPDLPAAIVVEATVIQEVQQPVLEHLSEPSSDTPSSPAEIEKEEVDEEEEQQQIEPPAALVVFTEEAPPDL